MDQGLIPRRYAKAIYKVALERGDDARIYELMQRLEAAFASNESLASTIANPFVANTDKTALLTTAAQATDADKTFADALTLLVDNRRISLMPLIAIAYCDIYRKEHRISRVKVTSAAKLDPEVEERIKKLVETHLDGGTMEYSTAIDPELIGGFAVQIDNERLDASVRNELKQLRIKLLN